MRSSDRQQRNGDSSFANSVLFGTCGSDNNQSPNAGGFSGSPSYIMHNRSTLTSSSPGFGTLGGMSNQSFGSASHGNVMSPPNRNSHGPAMSASRFSQEQGFSSNKSRISRSAHKPPLSSLSDHDNALSSSMSQSSHAQETDNFSTYSVRSAAGFGGGGPIGSGVGSRSGTGGADERIGGRGLSHAPPLSSTSAPDGMVEEQDLGSAPSSLLALGDADSHRGDSSTPLLTGAGRVEAAWRVWVVVYGYRSTAQNSQRDEHNMLLKFQQFGEVASYYSAPGGNWMLLKYESPIQAERAKAQHCSFISESDPSQGRSNLVAVERMDSRLAKYLDVSLDREARLICASQDTHISGDSSIGSTCSEGLWRRKQPPTQTLGERGELYLKPYRRKNICSRIMEYFFSY